ncbi:unnamed protein product [Boreogadus saida]
MMPGYFWLHVIQRGRGDGWVSYLGCKGLRVLHYTLSGGTGGTVTGRCTYPTRAGDWGPSDRGAPLKEMPLTTDRGLNSTGTRRRLYGARMFVFLTSDTWARLKTMPLRISRRRKLEGATGNGSVSALTLLSGRRSDGRCSLVRSGEMLSAEFGEVCFLP